MNGQHVSLKRTSSFVRKKSSNSKKTKPSQLWRKKKRGTLSMPIRSNFFQSILKTFPRCATEMCVRPTLNILSTHSITGLVWSWCVCTVVFAYQQTNCIKSGKVDWLHRNRSRQKEPCSYGWYISKLKQTFHWLLKSINYREWNSWRLQSIQYENQQTILCAVTQSK